MGGRRRTLWAAITSIAIGWSSVAVAEDATPEDATPEDATPEDATPDDATPDEPTPQPAAPQPLPPPDRVDPDEPEAVIGVDPYERDPGAPVPAAGEARGWAIRPRPPRREALIWAEKKAREGAQFTLQAVLAPVKGALSLNDRFEVARRLEELFYNEEHTAGVLPSLSFLSGFGTSIGGRVFHKDAFGNHEALVTKLEYGGRFGQMYQLSLDMPQIADNRYYIETAARYDRGAELFFYGFGHPDEVDTGMNLDPRAASVETLYEENRVLGLFGAGFNFGHQGLKLRTGLSAVYQIHDFKPLEDDDKGTSIEEVYDTSLIAGFDDGEDVLELTVDVVLDTRDRVGDTGAGFLLDGFAGGAPSTDGNLYLHYGFEASYFFTVFRRGRVLLLRAMLEGVEGNEEQIPFSELPRLGGKRRLRGYRTDRFRDDLATVGTIEYRYPIHYFASGVFFVEAGRVGKTYDDLIGLDHWQPGFGGGVVLHTLDDVSLRLDLSYGEGFEVFLSTDALRAFQGRRREL